MQINGNKSLLVYNTFHIDASCKYFSEVNSLEEIKELQQSPEYKNNPRLILGGGSNLLLTKDYEGLVIKNSIKGRELLREDEKNYYVRAGAGEYWHNFVLWCIEHNFAGVENLSLIPGNVGASPMQNIGAYGAEIREVFHELEAVHLETGEKVIFSNSDCHFGYRESVFKNKYKGQFIITSVTYRLNKVPEFNISYGAIENELKSMGVKELSIKAISDAVIRIRSSKLPDPAVIGNAGSFFKNPEISREKFEVLKEKFPAIVAYPLENGGVKLAAGWLIEQCGWKGKRFGDAGVHVNQALVLVNYGNAKGSEIYELSQQVLDSVKEKFDVLLEREVNII
ncbi:MAG: UDP-N-acetylmuramate dehydrogenase [Bacteroidia bacterium]